MARTKKVEESAIPFEDLLAFVQEQEKDDIRILKIKTSNTIAPDSVRLKFAHPLVEKGDQDGYETVDGEFHAYV
jgi:hypothetical protein